MYGFMFQKTLCFTSQMFYVRNIPIHSYTINKIIFIITTITIIIIIIIIIIFNFNITIIIVIIIIAIIKSTIVIIIILSFVLHFFDIKSLCVTFTAFELLSQSSFAMISQAKRGLQPAAGEKFLWFFLAFWDVKFELQVFFYFLHKVFLYKK